MPGLTGALSSARGLCCLLLHERMAVEVIEGDEGVDAIPWPNELLCLIMPGTSALLQLVEPDDVEGPCAILTILLCI